MEGKQGLGTMYPQAKLDVAGSVRIGSTYAGEEDIDDGNGGTDDIIDPNNGLIVEGTVGIGKHNPNTVYKLDVDGKVQISSVATDGGILKIGSTAQTSGDAVLIASVTGQNALKIQAGDLDMNTNTIKNVSDPSNDQDAATKAYVDNSHQDISGSSLSGTDLTIGITNGQSETIDISSLLSCNVNENLNFNAYSSGPLPSSWSGSSSNVDIHSETLGVTNNKFIKIYTANQWLQTPTYDISSCSNIKFGFRYKNVFGNITTESGDNLKIYISSDGGQNWTQIGNTILGSSIISNWTSSPTYYVNSALTSTFKIKFQTTCNELNDAWYIDDFYIISTKTDFDWINNNDDIYSGYGGNVGIGTSSPSSKLDVVGNTSISGELNMNSNRINNVVDPSNDQDAATKKYVDDQITISETNTTYSAGNDISNISLNNNIIQLEEDIDVSTIKASDVSGLSISDDDNNLGVFIKDGGNVGIGTSDPSSKLEIKGPLSSANNEDIILTVKSNPDGGASDNLFQFNQESDASLGAGYTNAVFRMGDAFTNASTPSKIVIRSDGTSYFNGGNIALPPNGYFSSISSTNPKARLYIAPGDICSDDGGFTLVPEYSSSKSYVKFNNDAWVTIKVPYGWKAVSVYFNFAGDAPSTSLRAYKASYSIATSSTSILNDSNPSDSPKTYNFNPDVSGNANDYIIIIFDNGAMNGNWHLAGGYVQLEKDTSVW